MKKTFLTLAYAQPLELMLIIGACSDTGKVTNWYTYFEPVYATKAEGRIYFKDGILFINESGEGMSKISVIKE